MDLVQSYWTILYFVFFLVVTSVILYFSADMTKSIVSMMNLVLVLIPLVSIVFGAIYYYNSREFTELLLAQPVRRSSLIFGAIYRIGTLTIDQCWSRDYHPVYSEWDPRLGSSGRFSIDFDCGNLFEFQHDCHRICYGPKARKQNSWIRYFLIYMVLFGCIV